MTIAFEAKIYTPKADQNEAISKGIMKPSTKIEATLTGRKNCINWLQQRMYTSNSYLL